MSASDFNPTNRTEKTSIVVEILEDGRRVELEVSTSHNKNNKSLVTYASRHITDGRFTRCAPFEDVQRVDSRPIARYSAKKLHEVHAEYCGLIGDADWQEWAKEIEIH